MAELINLTPHPCHFFERGKSEPIYVLPSRGQLRLLSAPQVDLPPIVQQPGNISIPVHTNQVFTGVDETTEGWPVWRDNPTASFIVSMATADYLCNHRSELGARTLYAPATDPKNVVRDSTGAIKGVYALEKFTSDGNGVSRDMSTKKIRVDELHTK